MLIKIQNSELFAIIDDEDFDLIKGYSWRINNSGYVSSQSFSNGKNYHILMHRLISNAKNGEDIDHKNHITIDNRKENLRACAHSKNMANRKMHKSNKLKVRGVYVEATGVSIRYRAEVQKDGKKVRSSHKSLDEARKWVRDKSLELHGDFACFDGL